MMLADDDHVLTPAGALASLPMVRQKSARVADGFERLAVEIRLLQANLDAALDALSPGCEALADTAFVTVVHVPLAPADFARAEKEIERMQDDDPELSVDDCATRIFLRGLARVTLRCDEEHF